MHLQYLKNRTEHSRYHEHVRTLLINFSSSAKMLVDTSRAGIRRIGLPEQVAKEFEARRVHLVSGNVNVALMSLLNAYYHRFVHSLSAHLDFNKSREEGMAWYSISTASLIRFAGIQKQREENQKHKTDTLELAINYLVTAPKNIPLLDLAKAYHQDVSSLYFWLLESLRYG